MAECAVRPKLRRQLRHIGARSRSRGLFVAASIILVLVIMIGVSAQFALVRDPAVENSIADVHALNVARELLIGSAASAPRPGQMPCPDTDGDGEASEPCDTPQSRVGLFPWKSLGAPDLRDSAGERLWYAVSANFRRATAPPIINSDSLGDFTVTGASTLTNVVAILIAPGTTIGTQIRAVGADITHYLDGENADGDLVFTDAPQSAALQRPDSGNYT